MTIFNQSEYFISELRNSIKSAYGLKYILILKSDRCVVCLLCKNARILLSQTIVNSGVIIDRF